MSGTGEQPPVERRWKIPSRTYETGRFPLLMGIVNVTPDSFSDGGAYFDPALAVEQAVRLVEDGADILDIGGESTRPGATPVPVSDELDRVIPVIRGLAGRVNVPISIDTTKAEVARQALEAGAEIVNDISGLTFDPDIIDVCRGSGAGVVCMHIQGTPQTMQDDPRYGDVVEEICSHLLARIADLVDRGLAEESIVTDPGIGFGKTADHNLELLASVGRFRELGRPVLVGHSRKGFLKRLLGRPVDERLAGSLGVSIALAAQHTDILRVHDVAATRDALSAWHTITAGRQNQRADGDG